MSLRPSELRSAESYCPLCLSQKQRESVQVEQTDPLIRWLFCPSCHGHSASMMPTDAFLREYYCDYYGQKEKKVTIADPERLARHIAIMLPKFECLTLSILDFGGGDGSVSKILVKLLQKRMPATQFELVLVDFIGVEVRGDEPCAFRHVVNLNELEGLTFDVILESTILEHVPDANACISRLISLMNTSGYIYARTPWAMPIKKAVSSNSLKYPMHVHDLGPSWWDGLPSRCDENLVMIRSFPSHIASGWSWSSIPRSLAAFFLKLPSRIEARLRRSPLDYVWQFAGGWEVLIQRQGLIK